MNRTYGQMMKEVFAIKTQEEADKWLEKEVIYMNKKNTSWSVNKCRDTVKSNLGYMAGYYDKSVSLKVHKFFGANHPIFGEPSYWDSMSPKKAFELGEKAGNA